jgi:signal transduction histidine kinase
MKATLAARLTTLWLLTIGGSLSLLTLCIAGFFFATYVQSINERIAAVKERTPEMMLNYHVPPRDPVAAAQAIVSRMYSSAGLRIVAFNSRIHVIDVAPSGPSQSSEPALRIVPNERVLPPATTVRERIALGLATTFGLQPKTFSYNGVNFDINPDPASLASSMERVGFVLLAILLAIGFASYAVAKKLKTEALRPIEEVISALEGFGVGDLSPRLVSASAAEEFHRIEAAYNLAVQRVTRAFSERDLAEAEVRRFFADAAHQLRTPLTVIQGFIGILLKNEPNAQADRERILHAMDKQSRSMGSMIEKLTILDRWEAARTNPQLIDIGDCVAGVLSPLASAFPDRKLSLSQQPACYSFVDPTEIKEAFGNVLDNALKYGGQGPVSVAVVADNGEVRVHVADGGPGLSDDEKLHVFERFYRGAQREIVGSGLGLAIVKRAAERAGGSVSLVSGRSGGTTVTIRLPRSVP